MPHRRNRTGEPPAYPDAVQIAERYVAAYTARDLDAMLAVLDENVVRYPAPLFGHRPHFGHEGVRAWWAAMITSDVSYDVVVSEFRPIGSERVAVLGEVRNNGRRLSPWAMVLRIRDGRIVESRSYLSDTETLEELRLLDAPASADTTNQSQQSPA